MLKLQIRQLVRYHWPMLLFMILMIAVSRAVGLWLMDSGIYSPYMSHETEVYFNELLEQSDGMTLEEQAEFIESRQTLAFVSGADQERLESIMRYRSELQSCFEVRGYRNYCRYGKGIVSMNFPRDIKTAPEKYRGFGVPTVVNSDPFNQYAYLSSFGLMPVLVMLLCGALMADSFERGVERMTSISSQRRLFCRAREQMMSGVIVLLWAIEQLSLLIISGTLKRWEYLTAPVQSVIGFGTSAFRGTIAQVIVFIAVRQLMGALLCWQIFAYAAKRLCSVKKYLLAAAGAIALMSLCAHYLPETAPYMFAGLCSTADLLGRLDYIPTLDGSEAVAVTVTLSALIGGVAVLRMEEAGKEGLLPHHDKRTFSGSHY